MGVPYGFSEDPQRDWVRVHAVIICSLVCFTSLIHFLPSLFVLPRSLKSPSQGLFLENPTKAASSVFTLCKTLIYSQWSPFWWPVYWDTGYDSPLHGGSLRTIFPFSVASPTGEPRGSERGVWGKTNSVAPRTPTTKQIYFYLCFVILFEKYIPGPILWWYLFRMSTSCAEVMLIRDARTLNENLFQALTG